MLTDRIKEFLQDNTLLQSIRERANEKMASVMSAIREDKKTVTDDPILNTVELREYPFWVRSWKGTIRTRTRRRR